MPLYVLALTDAPLDAFEAAGRRIHTESCDGIHVICERRTAAPSASETELRSQHALVIEIASRVRAILPVRFGSLIRGAELPRIIRAHHSEILTALDVVRDRVQMTIRVTGRPPARPGGTARASGRVYLDAKRRAQAPRLPKTASALLEALEPLVAAERREPGAGALLATVYHLVSVTNLSRYADVARRAPRSIVVTGPWPPFAFTPGLA